MEESCTATVLTPPTSAVQFSALAQIAVGVLITPHQINLESPSALGIVQPTSQPMQATTILHSYILDFYFCLLWTSTTKALEIERRPECRPHLVFVASKPTEHASASLRSDTRTDRPEQQTTGADVDVRHPEMWSSYLLHSLLQVKDFTLSPSVTVDRTFAIGWCSGSPKSTIPLLQVSAMKIIIQHEPQSTTNYGHTSCITNRTPTTPNTKSDYLARTYLEITD
ncbi:hypothetical protein NLJ89_g5993 [Agrocybe chaxingu]|uniref:Uncharacterized protein n=1 Tax=Agrocybe chaxingu TaxID=84603 RepID=A0A9W8MT46_9AGAR|nr:hypothetical protein NLJ89_g5993 [Agrocybe chaxingu]